MSEEINEQLKAFLKDWNELRYRLKLLVNFFADEIRIGFVTVSEDEVGLFWDSRNKRKSEHIHYKDEQRISSFNDKI